MPAFVRSGGARPLVQMSKHRLYISWPSPGTRNPITKDQSTRGPGDYMLPPRTAVALPVALSLLLAAYPAADAAVTYDEALWNSYNRYEASNIPANLMFADRSGASPYGGSLLFPLDHGYEVEVRTRLRVIYRVITCQESACCHANDCFAAPHVPCLQLFKCSLTRTHALLALSCIL